MDDPVSAGLLVVRIGLGAVFVAHGVKHLLGRQKTTKWFASLGFRAPGFQWFASTATELGAGVLLILGFLTAGGAAGVVGVMAVAFWTVHRAAGFFITAFMKEGTDVEGYEYVLFLAIAALGIAVAGPGEYSVDAQILLDGEPLTSIFDGWVGLALCVAAIGLAAIQLAVFWRPRSTD